MHIDCRITSNPRRLHLSQGFTPQEAPHGHFTASVHAPGAKGLGQDGKVLGKEKLLEKSGTCFFLDGKTMSSESEKMDKIRTASSF